MAGHLLAIHEKPLDEPVSARRVPDHEFGSLRTTCRRTQKTHLDLPTALSPRQITLMVSFPDAGTSPELAMLRCGRYGTEKKHLAQTRKPAGAAIIQ